MTVTNTARDARSASAAEASLPPHLGDEPAFGAPWQAQAFAMVLQLHQRGLFSWSEWAQALAQQVRLSASSEGRIDAATETGADPGELYYSQWLCALEALLAQKGLASAAALADLSQRWAEAAARTPHGQSIELR